jgi:hypothetical protein
MFHWVRGIPFDFNSGAYDNLNMWEQIDNGDQYTPAKKWLLAVPIGLFLVSTHYTHYDLTYFCINLLATIAVILPKLPAVSSSLCSYCLSTNTMSESSLALHLVFWSTGRSVVVAILFLLTARKA